MLLTVVRSVCEWQSVEYTSIYIPSQMISISVEESHDASLPRASLESEREKLALIVPHINFGLLWLQVWLLDFKHLACCGWVMLRCLTFWADPFGVSDSTPICSLSVMSLAWAGHICIIPVAWLCIVLFCFIWSAFAVNERRNLFLIGCFLVHGCTLFVFLACFYRQCYYFYIYIYFSGIISVC